MTKREITEKIDRWLKNNESVISKVDEDDDDSNRILTFSTTLSSKMRRTVHEIATRRGLFHSSFRDSEDRKYVGVARTWKVLEDLRDRTEKMMTTKTALTLGKRETVDFMEKSQMTYKFEDWSKRLNNPSTSASLHPNRETVLKMANRPPSNFLSHAHEDQVETTTSCTYVNSKIELETLSRKLELETEVGVSMKFHDIRSYYGFACLLVLSTRNHIYVIDTLVLRHQISNTLRDFFQSTKILKVFHSAKRCIESLHRDFEIHVVHVFDICVAAKEMNIKVVSLRSLLTKTCNILQDESEIKLMEDSNRQSFRIDWRVRALVKEAIQFAVNDSKYLLKCFDALINRLIAFSEMKKKVCIDTKEEEEEEDIPEISYCGSSDEDEEDDDDDDWLDDVMDDLYGDGCYEEKNSTQNKNLTSVDKIGLLGHDSVANVDNVDFSNEELPESVARAYATSQINSLNSRWKPNIFVLDAYKNDKCYRTKSKSVDRFSKSKTILFRNLFALRDKIARECDESPTFVVPSAAYVHLSRCYFSISLDSFDTHAHHNIGYVLWSTAHLKI